MGEPGTRVRAHPADLGRSQGEALHVESFTERERHVAAAEPGELHDVRFRRRQRERAAASLRPAAWKTRARSGGAWSGVAKRTPKAVATARRASFTSTSSTSAPGVLPARYATMHPNTPPPTTVTRSPARGSASHSAFTAVSRF